MTEHLHPGRMRQIAQVTEPLAMPRRVIPSLQWAIDAATGRAVGCWVPGNAPHPRWNVSS